MNLRQFLSAAASAAILLTSVTVPNATAETAVIELEPNTRVSVTVTDPQTTTAPRTAQYTTTMTTTVTNAPVTEFTGYDTNHCCVTEITTNAQDYYSEKNNNKLKPENGKYKITLDQYSNVEFSFGTDDTKNEEVWAIPVIDPTEDMICNSVSYKYGEDSQGRDMYKLVLHGDRPGTQDYFVEDSDGNSCIIGVTVNEKIMPKAEGTLKTKDDVYGENGNYTFDDGEYYHEIGFENAVGCVFANKIEDDSELMVGVSSGFYVSDENDLSIPTLNVTSNEACYNEFYVTDAEGKSCVVSIKVYKPVETVVTTPKDPTTTTTMTTLWGGEGTGGWNPPPYMTTTAISNVLVDLNNDKLRAEKYNVTVDQYSNTELYFEKTVIRYDRLYTTFFDNDNIASCATVPNDYKNKTIDGLAYKMVIHGNKPGTTKALVQDEDGNSCIINITVKAKDAPVINNKLHFLDEKEGEEYSVDISGHDHKFGGVLLKEYPDYVFAQVIEGNDDLTFGLYTSATSDGAFRRVEISTYGNGTYKVLFTDNEGNNAVATVNVSEAPYADPNPYPDQPRGTEVPDLSGETTTTTTLAYADGGEVGTAPMTTEGFVLTTTTGTTPAPAPAEIPTEDFGEPTFIGDTDLSGDFGIADVTALGKHLLSRSSYTLSKESKANSDMNRDKLLNSLDISIMIEMNLRPEMLFVPPVDIQPVNTEVVITPPVITTTTDTNDEIIIIGSGAPYINNNVKLALKEYISNKCNNFNYNSVTFGLDKRRKIQKSANDNLNYIGDEYYFNLYYKGIMLNPEKYQINEKFYDDGTYTVTGNFVDDSFMERLNSIDLNPVLTEDNAVLIAKEYASGIDIPDVKESEKVFLEFGQFYPTEKFGKEISLIIYSVENSILAYKICDTDMNYNDVKSKDSSVSDFVVNIAIYVDAQTEQVIDHHFSIDSIVT